MGEHDPALTRDRAAAFWRAGFLYWPSLLPHRIVEGALVQLSSLAAEGGAHVFTGVDGTTVRAVYGRQERGGIWRSLSHHAPLVRGS